MSTDQGSSPALVADAGPLIHLDELGCSDLFDDFSIVRIPAPVWREALVHRPRISPPRNGVRMHVEVSRAPELQVLIRNMSLDLGEQAALTLMRAHPDSIFVTDDSAARLACKCLGLRVHGTLGILLRAIRRDQRTRDQVLDLLDQLPKVSTLHVRRDLLLSVIRSVKQNEPPSS